MSEVTWKDTGWKLVLATAGELGRHLVKVGVVGDAADQPHADSDLTNAEVAAVNEYGSDDGHVPRRSFIKSTFDRSHGDVALTLASAARTAIYAGGGVVSALNRAGAWAAAKVRNTVLSGVPPANADATVAKKKSNVPLMDTRQMLEAIGHLVFAGRASSFDYEELELSGMTQEGFE